MMPRDEELLSGFGLVTHSLADGILLVRAAGDVDIESGPVVSAAVMAVSPDAAGAIVDLAEVPVVSAAGFRALADAAARLADHGQRLLLAGCQPTVLLALRHMGAAGVVEIVDTVEAALAALDKAPNIHVSELTQVIALALTLPAALRTRPVIAGAAELVRRRYGLADTDTALALLREASQRHNLKLRSVAAAVLTTRPPTPGSRSWFTGRRRHPAPPVTFTVARREWRESRSSFLADVLNSALTCMWTNHGDLRLVDPVLGGLRQELHHGLPPEFTKPFAHVGGGGCACVAALRSRRRVVVPNIVSSAIDIDPEMRGAIQAVGTRAMQSTPLITPDGRCAGVVSTMHVRAERTPSALERSQLDRISAEAGAWLAWHQRTIVLDALESLHQAARGAR